MAIIEATLQDLEQERRISTAAGVWEEAVAAAMEEKREK